MNREMLELAGILNENVGGNSKAYETIDSEVKTLTIGKEVMIRDASGEPTGWKKLVVKKFVDGNRVEFTGPKTGQTYVFDIRDCEVDI
jgi:hypothetical protein